MDEDKENLTKTDETKAEQDTYEDKNNLQQYNECKERIQEKLIKCNYCGNNYHEICEANKNNYLDETIDDEIDDEAENERYCCANCRMRNIKIIHQMNRNP